MKLLVIALLPLLAFGQLQWHKEVICENESKTISCKEGEKLSIEKAFYGRADAHTCLGVSVKTTRCQASDSMKIIGNKCNGKSSCLIEASNSEFGEPCEGTSKYVEISFLCEKTTKWPKVVICEGFSRTISCPAGRVLKIKKGYYGRQDWTTCPHPSIRDLHCAAIGSQRKMKQICQGKNSCSISAVNSLFGDPCRGTYKYVEMSYKCAKQQTPPPVDPCVDENGHPISTAPFEKPGDCDNFYQCSNGILHTMPCAPGTAFNPEIGVCDWPSNVEGCS